MAQNSALPDRAWIVATNAFVRAALGDGVAAAGLDATIIDVPESLSDMTREHFREAFGAAGANGAPALVVISLVSEASLKPTALADLSPGEWSEMAEAPILALFHIFQGLLPVVEGKKLAIVVVGATLGNVGAPNLVPLTTCLEAQRGAIKSIARQIGDRGITVNWVGVSTNAYAPSLALAAIPHSPELGQSGYALGRIPKLQDEVARAVTMFSSGAASPVTGASINIDGGEWMLP